MTAESLKRFGSLVIDHDAREVFVDGHQVCVTAMEFTLLAALTDQPRHAFTSEHLLRLITGNDWVSETHTIQVYVSRLRAKLGESGASPRWIHTVHGFGYRFEPGTNDHATPVSPQIPLASQTRPAFLLLNVERRIMWASDYVETLLGWQAREIEGAVLFDLVHPEDRPRAIAAGPGLNAGHPTDFVLRLRSSANGYQHIETLTRPIIDADGRAVAFHGELRPTRGRNRAITRRPVALHLATA